MMFPKPKTPRNTKYLAWIRTLPCIYPVDKGTCGVTPARESHHTETGGIALVGSDYSAVPCCLDHHREIHQKHSKRGPWSEDELQEITARLRAAFEGIK